MLHICRQIIKEIACKLRSVCARTKLYKHYNLILFELFYSIKWGMCIMCCTFKKREISVALLLIFVLRLCNRSPLKFQLMVFHAIQIMWFLSYHAVVCQHAPWAPVTMELDAEREPCKWIKSQFCNTDTICLCFQIEIIFKFIIFNQPWCSQLIYFKLKYYWFFWYEWGKKWSKIILYKVVKSPNWSSL